MLFRKPSIPNVLFARASSDPIAIGFRKEIYYDELTGLSYRRGRNEQWVRLYAKGLTISPNITPFSTHIPLTLPRTKEFAQQR